MRTIKRFIAALLIAVLFTSCSVFQKSEEDKMVDLYDSDIRAYLADRYGKDLSEGVEITCTDAEKCVFELTTPVLRKGATFEVHLPSPDNNKYSDTLLSTFWLNYDFRRDFSQYVHDMIGLPQDIVVNQLHLEYFDFDGYKYGDDYASRFATAKYNVMIVEWKLNSIDLKKCPELVETFYRKFWPLFDGHIRDKGSLLVYFDVNGDVPFEAVYHIRSKAYLGPDVVLYEYADKDLRIVDEYRFN